MKNILRTLLQQAFGFKTYLFLFSIYCIDRVRRQKYEKEFLYFLSLIPDKGIVLDIGANIGITMVPIAQKLKNVRVHAFEPIKENYTNLERLVKHFKLSNIQLHNIALGNNTGTLRMIMPMAGNSRMQGLSKVYQPELNEKGVIYDVPVEELDKIYPAEKNITAIKIDVENFEYEVLSSAKKLLQDNMPIIYCELWNNEKRSLVFEYVRSLKYAAFIYDEKLLALKPVIAERECEENNFFFIPETQGLSQRKATGN